MALIQVGGDGAKAQSLPAQPLDQRRDGRTGLRHARQARGGGGRDVRSRIAELYPARLGLGQGNAGALGNHLALMLGDGGEDVQGQPVGTRHVHGDELDPALHQACDEGDVAGQPVELGDDQRGALPLAGGDGGMEFRPVVLPAALDLGEFGEDVATPSRKISDGAALGLQSEAAGSLAVGGDAVVSDEINHIIPIRSRVSFSAIP